MPAAPSSSARPSLLAGVPSSLRLAVVATALLAGPLAVAGAPDATAAPAPASEWTLGPADADGPDDRISLRHELDPGTSVDDHVAVTNLGGTAETFVVEAGDGRTGASGAFDVAPAQESPGGPGTWVALGGLEPGGTLALEPGETRVLPVTVTVPADATPGDHPVGITAGVTSGDEVTVSNRLGVRLHLRVAGEVAPQLAVTDVRTSYEPSLVPFAPGTARVSYDVANEGNVRVAASPTVSTGGFFGLGATTGSGEPRELLPGESATQTVELPAAPSVLLAGDLTVSPLAVGDDALPGADAASADLAGLALSWTGLALVLLVAAVVVLLAVRARRRRGARTAAAGGGAAGGAAAGVGAAGVGAAGVGEGAGGGAGGGAGA
ncbi:COG1470 family protein [Frigoribacterium salinisoli]